MMKSKFAQWLEAQYVNWMAKDGRHKTQSEFAQWLGIHRSQLNMYLNGSRTPTGKNVDQLAQRLGAGVYDLLGLARPDPQIEELIMLFSRLPLEQKEVALNNLREMP